MAGVKQRHGCLTAWLVFMIVTNSIVALVYLFASGLVRRGVPNAPAWAFPTLAVLCFANVAFAIALFQWKKWGFFGFIATAIVTAAINLNLGLNVVQVSLGLIGIVILYGVLQIGDNNKAWPQLE